MVWNAASGYQSSTTIKGKLAAFSATFLLLISTLVASASPFMERAFASQPNVNYTPVDLSSGWVVDRTAPSGGYGVEMFQGRESLAVNIDPDEVPSESWYSYEGLKKAISPSDTVKADIYIEDDWADMDVATGLWGVAKNSSDEVVAYPIVNYVSSTGGWKIWDTNDGNWIVSTGLFNAGAWNSIELVINELDRTKTDVYINDIHVGQSTSSSMDHFSDIIINTYNYGTDSYTVHWSDVSFGVNPDPTSSNALTLSGSVYRDKALNDCDNKSECENRTSDVLEGWEVRLYKENQEGEWDRVKTATTNESGVYELGRYQAAGVYHACVVLQDGWSQSAQNWSGSNYRVNTQNLSGAENEGEYCTATNYTDEADRSQKAKIGVVDTESPEGDVSYRGGKVSKGIHYLSSIDDFSFEASFDDNYKLDRTSYVVWKVDRNFENRQLFCGNWGANSGTNTFLEEVPANISVDVGDCTYKKWGDGQYEIGHRVYDTAGNRLSLNSPTQKFVIDNDSPARVTGLHIEQDGKDLRCSSFITQRMITVDWDRSIDVNFSHYNYQNKDERTVDTPVNSEFTGQIRDEDGYYQYRVQAVDKAGNEGEWSEWCGVTLDRISPVATIDYPANDNAEVGGPIEVAVSAIDDNIKSHWVEIAGPDGNKQYFSNMNSSESTWSFQWDTTGVHDGEYTIRYVATDMAGNRSDDPGYTKSVIRTVAVDNTAPEVSGTDQYDLLVGDKLVLQPKVLEEGLSFEWLDNDGAAVGNPAQDGQSFVVGPAAPGEYNVTVIVTDAVGNATEHLYRLFVSLPQQAEGSSDNGQQDDRRQGGSDVRTSGSTPITSFGAAQTAGQGFAIGGGAVLGETDQNDEEQSGQESGDVFAATTANQASSQSTGEEIGCGKFLGLCWYWWVPIVAVIAGVIYAVVRPRREV